MKSLTKMASVVLMLTLLFTVFPMTSMNTAHAATCDWAKFIADVTVPDGSTYAPGATFTKTWRLQNIGTCTWTTNYALVFSSGAQMGAPSTVNFPNNVAPGGTIDLSVNITAPNTAGHYFGYWKLRNAGGTIFGIGSSTTAAFWIEINVGSSTGGGYDFTAHAAEATWSSGAGVLGFPVADGDARGFAFKQDNPKFESGFQLGKPGLLVAPQNLYNGYIQARYPAVRVQTGDRFQATVGCDFGATNCYVAYRLDYQIGNGPIRTYWSFREKYEGWTYFANLNLNPLAGQNVTFILFISAYGNATGDRAIWGNPVILPAGGSIITSTPTVTGTPPTPTPTSTKPTPTNTLAASSCDKVKFEKDVTYPDGSLVQAGTSFNKTWRLRNIGTCTWSTSYQLVFYSGEQMNGPSAINFPKTVGPNDVVELTVTLTAPNSAGNYRGYWMFRNTSGQNFGIGYPNYNLPWWVDIKVTGSSGPTATFTSTSTTTLTPTPTTTFTPTSTATPTATPN